MIEIIGILLGALVAGTGWTVRNLNKKVDILDNKLDDYHDEIREVSHEQELCRTEMEARLNVVERDSHAHGETVTFSTKAGNA